MAQQAERTLTGTVGVLGDSERLNFEGNSTFTADQIRNALMRTTDFLLASHRAAPLDECPPAVQRLVLAGYRQCGFPEVRVSAALDAAGQAISVVLSEGPRYMCGPIELLGAETIPLDKFVRLMTERRVKKSNDPDSQLDYSSETEDPYWRTDKPAPFSKAGQRGLRRAARSVLADLGYYFASLTVEVVPVQGTSHAKLSVRIEAEGSRTIGAIQIGGNEKNTRDEILEYLELEEGMQLDHALLVKTDTLLWHAARFLDYQVTPEVDVEHATIKLNITVREYEHAPALSEPFSEEDAVLLRLCDWLSGFTKRQDDLRLVLPVKELDLLVQLAVSPTQGVAVAVRGADESGQADLLQAGVLTSEYMALYSPAQKTKYKLSSPSSGVVAGLSVLPNKDPNQEGGLFAIMPSLGLNSKRSGKAYDLNLKLAPVFFLYWARKDNVDLSHLLDQGLIRLAGDGDFHVRVDTRSGRLIEVTHVSHDKRRFEMAVDRGLFDQQIQDIERLTADHANRFVADRPIGSTLRYLGEQHLVQMGMLKRYGDQLDLPEQGLIRALPLLGSILYEATEPLDQWFVAQRRSGKDHFTVPSSYGQSGGSLMNILVSVIAAQVFGMSNEMFPHGSWPWTLAHETVFVLGGMGKYTEAELRRTFESQEVGPIGYLATAKLLTRVNPSLSRLFAAKGLGKLSFSDFEKDWRLFMWKDHLLSRCVDGMARALKGLDDEEVETLLTFLSDEQGGFMKQYLKRLKDDPAEQTRAAIASPLERYWEKELKDEVRQALRRLAFPSRTSPPGPTQ